eukprot:3890804-Prymnesium_polylepis.1
MPVKDARPGFTPDLVHLQVVDFALVRARHQERPVDRNALEQAGRVEGPALLEAQHCAVTLGNLS